MDTADSTLGLGDPAFPQTRWSIVCDAVDAASPTRHSSLEVLAGTYWRPVYAHFRRKWGKSHDEAKDLTQDFFLALQQKDLADALSPREGRFRSYVMAALDNFARMEWRSKTAQKRGGGALPFDIGEGFEPSAKDDPDQAFQREWKSAVLDKAFAMLREEYSKAGRAVALEIFQARISDVGEEPRYEDLAARFGLSSAAVRNHLHAVRARFRELIWRVVRDSVLTDDEARAEMKELLGGE
ncbi:MAG TPA: sigma-70 family RNA polymerase sigma factor [Planctomycetota bacterium]|nr:sigma-70 family RNA polymerase sigma factor [Planctomycetota bacterium]